MFRLLKMLLSMYTALFRGGIQYFISVHFEVMSRFNGVAAELLSSQARFKMVLALRLQMCGS